MDKLPEKIEVIPGLKMRIVSVIAYKTIHGKEKIAFKTRLP